MARGERGPERGDLEIRLVVHGGQLRRSGEPVRTAGAMRMM